MSEVNFRRKDQKVKEMVFPLLLLSDVIHQIATSKNRFVSSINLKSGYFQVEMEKEPCFKTAFICHHMFFSIKVCGDGVIDQ